MRNAISENTQATFSNPKPRDGRGASGGIHALHAGSPQVGQNLPE
jgi:hypothetical protein